MAAESNRGPDDDVRSQTDNAPSDGSLLRQYRAGNEDAARQLYVRYAERLRGVIRKEFSDDLQTRLDHDDILQSAFGSIFRGAQQGAYDVPAGKELWHLFFTITVNKVRASGARHRARKRSVGRTSGGDAIEEAVAQLGSESQPLTFLKLFLEEALEKLTADQERAIRLRMEEYEVEEIAEAMGRPKRSVERLLQEGRNQLRVLLNDAVP